MTSTSLIHNPRAATVFYLALLAVAILAPLLGLYPVFVMKLLCFAIFACAFNLLLGYTGLLSFGHAAYFGAAAYTTGYLVKTMHWTPEIAILGGMAFAAVSGLVVAPWPSAARASTSR